MSSDDMVAIHTACAICGTKGNAREIYQSKLAEEHLDEKSFSARRFYDKKIHFRFVCCNRCGLLRSDPIIDKRSIVNFYQNSRFTYGQEIPNLQKTYGYYLSRLNNLLPSRENLLEIGCGNGFFLEEALRQGFENVFGVEPSFDAVSKAPPQILQKIKVGMFKQDLFTQNFFDVICIFQTMDHFFEPSAVLSDCSKLLKPNGLMLAINHDARSWSALLLREKSPIIDIEHTYLYDKRTMRMIFEKNGLQVLKIFGVRNRCSLGYLLSLLPLNPTWVKDCLRRFFTILKLDDVSVSLPIGNLGIIAKKRQNKQD